MTTDDDLLRNRIIAARDALIGRTVVKVRLADGTAQHQSLPSLLDQLEASKAASASGGDGPMGGKPGSRPVANVAVLDVLISIEDRVRFGHGELANRVWQYTDHAIESPIGDSGAWWLVQLTAWQHQARAALRLDSARRQWVRGLACPECGQSSAQTESEAITPALAVSWRCPQDGKLHSDEDWHVSAITCKACGRVWLRGPGMLELISAMVESGSIEQPGEDLLSQVTEAVGANV